MICTKHQIGMGKHLIVIFLRKPDANNFGIVEISLFMVSPVIQLYNPIINDRYYFRSYFMFRTNDDKSL